METLAVSPRRLTATLSLRRGAPSFSALAWTNRRQPRVIGFSPARHFKCSAITDAFTPSAASAQEEKARFVYAAERGSNLIPLYRCIFCDHLTPVLAYRCLVEEKDTETPSFLFEAVEQGLTGTSVGRYSVIGAHPAMEIVSKENMVSIVDCERGWRSELFVEDPTKIPLRIMEGWSPQFIDELPDVFCGNMDD